MEHEELQPSYRTDHPGAVLDHLLVDEIAPRGTVSEEDVIGHQEAEKLRLGRAEPQTRADGEGHLPAPLRVSVAAALADIVDQGGEKEDPFFLASFHPISHPRMGIVITAGEKPLHLREGLELVLMDRVKMKGVMLDQGMDRTKLRDQHLKHIRIVKSPHGLDLGVFLPQHLNEPLPDEPWIVEGFGNVVSLFPAPLECLDPQRHL